MTTRTKFILLGLFVLGVWGATPWLIPLMSGWNKACTDMGEFGDIYGTTNSLFSGLAFLGLIYTIHLQREDLKQNMEELRLTRVEVAGQNRALTDQTLVMQRSALIAALPVVIQQERSTLRALAPYAVQDLHTDGLTANMIARLLRKSDGAFWERVPNHVTHEVRESLERLVRVLRQLEEVHKDLMVASGYGKQTDQK